MNAKEAIAKQIAVNTAYACPQCGYGLEHISGQPDKVASSLLAMKQECPNCEGKGGYNPDDGKSWWGTCPICHGTGLSDKKILYTREELIDDRKRLLRGIRDMAHLTVESLEPLRRILRINELEFQNLIERETK